MHWQRPLLIVVALLTGVPPLKAKHAQKDSDDDLVNIIFAGDISFDGTIGFHARKGDHTYNDNFAKIAPYIREADFAIVNVESPFITEEMSHHKATKGPRAIYLRADVESASSFSYAGFDLVSLANNHMNDFGEVPVNFTAERIHETGVSTFGVTYGPTFARQEPFILEKKGVKIGILTYCKVVLKFGTVGCEELRSRYSAGPAPYRFDVASEDIKKLKKRVDVILVYMHWGKEYYLEPLGSQRKMAKELRSLGVHAIIGCHPHVLQPHCYEDDQVVAFSLGNFLFPWHIPQPVFMKNKHTKLEIRFYEESLSGCMPPTKASRLFRVWVNKKGLVKADYLPIALVHNPSINCLQPQPVDGAKWIEVCSPEDKACMKKCP